MKMWFLTLAILLSQRELPAQDHNEANYDETKVPAYTLPDALKTGSNKKVGSKAVWERTRRPEILRLFENNVYGQMPEAYDRIAYTVVGEQTDAMCVSNCSGNTGAALARRRFGERIRRINTSFPHWFCENYKKFNDREDSLPVDQHMLISLIAPRPVYATNATKDLWADPKGTFLALKNAEKVYALYGLSSKLPADPPEVETPIAAPPLGYHIREGEHNLTVYDWNRFIVFANNYFNIRSAPSPAKKAGPVKIILDSDIGQDCDDAGAMALMHQFADRGEAEILATMFPMHDPMGAPAMDVINTYYGRPNIPIGTYKGNYEYKGKLYDHYNTKLALAFPHDLKRGEDAPDAVMLYRQILAKQPAGSVVIVVVGPERLLADLLQTGPDAYSKLSGYDLVKQKVKLLSVMGAGFPSGDEWNIKIAPDAAKLVAETWPTPIVYSGFEIGSAIRTGSRLLTETDADNPVRASFENHPFVDKLTRDRQSWDQTAMLYAVRGAQDYWSLQSNGSNAIDSTGKNKWLPGPAKNHTYLTLQKPASQMQKIIEDLMVAPPGSAKK